MAKNSPQPPSGRSKIRVFFVDADLAPGDMQQLTDALTSAIRPTHQLTRIAAPAPRVGAGGNGKHSEDVELEEIVAEEVDSEDEVDASEDAPAPRAPRKNLTYKVPQVIALDLDSDVSWPSFANSIKPTNAAMKYLTVATWFNRHRGITAIGIDHVYTCFLHPKVKWSTTIKDFDGNFRYHKKRGRMKKEGTGLYAINQIGMGEVDELATTPAE